VPPFVVIQNTLALSMGGNAIAVILFRPPVPSNRQPIVHSLVQETVLSTVELAACLTFIRTLAMRQFQIPLLQGTRIMVVITNLQMVAEPLAPAPQLAIP